MEMENEVSINEEYLQVLREKEDDSSLHVTKCNILTEVGKGEGYLSNMLRVEADVVRNGIVQKEHLIVKMLPTDDLSRRVTSKYSAFPKIRMFSKILPQVSKLLQSVGKPSDIGAKFYYCKNTIPYVLIVEDLTAKGFKMADRRKGLDLEHCKLVMNTLGRYHAATIALHEVNPELIEQYTQNFYTEEATDNFFENNIRMSLNAAALVADKIFPNEKHYGEQLRRRTKTLKKDIKDLFTVNKNNFNVLLHGDFRVNNFMFRYNETSGEVEEVRFVDFQDSCYASAGIDLQLFIRSSPNEDVLVNHTNDLFKSYHTELCETLKFLGYDHLKISFSQLLLEYNKNVSFGFLIGIVSLPLFMADKDDDFDIAAITENKIGSESFNKRASNPIFVPILKRLLPIFHDLGAF